MTALIIFPLILAAILVPVQGQGYFDDAIANPFGVNLTSSESDLVFHALADIDADGDLDDFVSHRQYLFSCWIVSAFEFYENQGTSECPEYVKIPNERFGLPEFVAAITFVDIDADGDLDAFISNHCWASTVTFHENTGTATLPQFSSTPTQTLDTDWGIGFAMFAFGDLDGDGDYDALVNGLRPAVFKYLENTGTPEAFEFGSPVNNPFGLSIPSFDMSEWSQFVDWDCDGDLDILNAHWQGGNNHNDWMLYIHENNGTTTAPSFLPPVNTNQLVMAIAFGDMDGDGDADVFSDEYYFKNITATGCVTLPTAGFSTVKNGLTIEFVNEASGQATACRPVQYNWNFGDGTTSDEAGPIHTFAAQGTYNVCLTVEDIAGEVTTCEDVEVTVTAISDRESSDEIFIFPNPASDFLTVKIDGEMRMQDVTIEMLNPLGKVMKRLEYDAPDFAAGVQIDLSDLGSGIYTLKINNDGQFLSGQFLKVE